MTRNKQLKLIRQCLKDLGAVRVRLLDCSTLLNINEDYKNSFWGTEIDTMFYCDDSNINFDNCKKEIGNNRDFYCVKYNECHVFFNASPFMQDLIDNKCQSPHSNNIRNIRKYSH